MIWRSWARPLVGSNLGCVVFLAKWYLNQKYISFLLSRWPKFSVAFKKHWLGHFELSTCEQSYMRYVLLHHALCLGIHVELSTCTSMGNHRWGMSYYIMCSIWEYMLSWTPVGNYMSGMYYYTICSIWEYMLSWALVFLRALICEVCTITSCSLSGNTRWVEHLYFHEQSYMRYIPLHHVIGPDGHLAHDIWISINVKQLIHNDVW